MLNHSWRSSILLPEGSHKYTLVPNTDVDTANPGQASHATQQDQLSRIPTPGSRPGHPSQTSQQDHNSRAPTDKEHDSVYVPFQPTEEKKSFWEIPTAKEVSESVIVQSLTVFLIILNAVVIGFETDMPHLFKWSVVEHVFVVMFALELSLRLAANGFEKFFSFSNPDITWNIFDITIVGMGVINTVVDLLFPMMMNEKGATGSSATVFRLIRLLRILRVLRIIRIVRFLKQLYLLAYGFMEGTMAVFWVAFLASFMLYICSVVLVRTYGREQTEGREDPHAEFFAEKFGSIPRAMLSLFELISAPDLNPYKGPMYDNPPLVIFLVVFIVLGSFGVNGLLVALINESILEKNQARIEQERYDREWKRKMMQKKCAELFDEIDVNKNRVLPRAELIHYTSRIARLCEEWGANFQQNDLEQMFYIMDHNDTGIIARWEFVQCVVELCDQIRPMSIMELNYQVAKCANKIYQCDAKVDDIVKFVEDGGSFPDPRSHHSPAVIGAGPQVRFAGNFEAGADAGAGAGSVTRINVVPPTDSGQPQAQVRPHSMSAFVRSNMPRTGSRNDLRNDVSTAAAAEVEPRDTSMSPMRRQTREGSDPSSSISTVQGRVTRNNSSPRGKATRIASSSPGDAPTPAANANKLFRTGSHASCGSGPCGSGPLPTRTSPFQTMASESHTSHRSNPPALETLEEGGAGSSASAGANGLIEGILRVQRESAIALDALLQQASAAAGITESAHAAVFGAASAEHPAASAEHPPDASDAGVATEAPAATVATVPPGSPSATPRPESPLPCSDAAERPVGVSDLGATAEVPTAAEVSTAALTPVSLGPGFSEASRFSEASSPPDAVARSALSVPLLTPADSDAAATHVANVSDAEAAS